MIIIFTFFIKLFVFIILIILSIYKKNTLFGTFNLIVFSIVIISIIIFFIVTYRNSMLFYKTLLIEQILEYNSNIEKGILKNNSIKELEKKIDYTNQ
ncbi:hypothetical protein [Cetobacterium ceti]|uniref:hypothetical protein n=1 Tax=Cetobacterium ceti TaxID=180163 RepID=UPI000999F8EC|nr:hypothetical protein [Cetobacterium ceti]